MRGLEVELLCTTPSAPSTRRGKSLPLPARRFGCYGGTEPWRSSSQPINMPTDLSHILKKYLPDVKKVDKATR
jgi:hypothetical protein